MADSHCVFCDIIQGNAQASLVYADDQVVAFMDVQPVNEGHLLVAPRFHAAQLADLDPALGVHLFRIGMQMDEALRRSGLPCEGVNLFLADGHAAGQTVPHVHLHVLPRFRGDGFGFRFPAGYLDRPDRRALELVAEKIKGALAERSDAG